MKKVKVDDWYYFTENGQLMLYVESKNANGEVVGQSFAIGENGGGGSLPSGGEVGDLLTKTGSGADDVEWVYQLPHIDSNYNGLLVKTNKYDTNRSYNVEEEVGEDEYVTHNISVSNFVFDSEDNEIRFDITNNGNTDMNFNGDFEFNYRSFDMVRIYDESEEDYENIVLTGTGDISNVEIGSDAVKNRAHYFATISLYIHFNIQAGATAHYVIETDGIESMDTVNTYDVMFMTKLPINSGSTAQMIVTADGQAYTQPVPKSIPYGGSAGQVLKKSDNDYDGNSQWSNVREVPVSGSENDVLTKIGSGDNDFAWRRAQGGLPVNGTKGEVVVKTKDGSVWEDPKNIAPIVGVYAEDPAFGGSLMVLTRMIDNHELNIQSVEKTGTTTYIIEVYSPEVLHADGGYTMNIPALAFNLYDVPVFSGYPSELKNPKYFRTSEGLSGFFTATYYPSTDIPANTVVSIPISVSDFNFYFDGFNYRRDVYEDFLVNGNNVWPRVDALYDSTGQTRKIVKINRSSASLNTVRITNCVVDDTNRKITLTVQNDEASMLQLWGYFRVNGYGFSSFTTADPDATVNLAYKDSSIGYVYIMRYIPANGTVTLVITYDAGSVASMITDYVYSIDNLS